jgi:hypothetical protein
MFTEIIPIYTEDYIIIVHTKRTVTEDGTYSYRWNTKS